MALAEMQGRQAAPLGPTVDGDGVTFTLDDPYSSLTRVLLAQELGLPGPNEFVRSGRQWTYRLQRPVLGGRPAVDRMEYLFEVRDRNDRYATITDPHNHRRGRRAFGDKSVIEFPGYARPDWLDDEPAPARTRAVSIDAPALGARLDAVLWQPQSLGERQVAPLVVVHDGPEFDAIGRFTEYLGVQVARDDVRPVRALLVAPGDRNDWYSANPRYARALVEDVLGAAWPVRVGARVGVGASLGALSMLHAHLSHPGTFDALMLLSGSFFTEQLDRQESAFPGFEAITSFVASIPDSTAPPVPVVIASGLMEENHANNVELANVLRGKGYPVREVHFADMHNYTAWRDALHPHLAALINTVSAPGGPR